MSVLPIRLDFWCLLFLVGTLVFWVPLPFFQQRVFLYFLFFVGSVLCPFVFAALNLAPWGVTLDFVREVVMLDD